MGKKSRRKKERRERGIDKPPYCLVCRYQILTSEKIMILDDGEVHLHHLKYYREAKENGEDPSFRFFRQGEMPRKVERQKRQQIMTALSHPWDEYPFILRGGQRNATSTA